MAITLNKVTTASNEHPTLAEIRESILAAAKEAAAAGRHDTLDVALDSGKYVLSEPFVLSQEENPELASVDIILRAKHAGEAKISSRIRLSGADFEPVPDKPYYKYQFKKGADGKYPLFRELFLNFHRIEAAKSPAWKNPIALLPEERNGQKKLDGLYVPYEIAKQLAEGELGSTELMIHIEWEFVTLHVGGVDLSNVREINGEKYALITGKGDDIDFLATHCHRSLNINDRVAYFFNSPAFLTETDTYAYDYENGTLYLNPADKEWMAYHAIEYPALENLLVLDGIKNFTLSGIAFSGATSRFACENPYYAAQANEVHGAGRLRHAAVLARNTTGLTIKHCIFRNLGGNGIQLIDHSRRARISSNLFENVDMCAVTVGNPTTAWQEERNRNHNIRIENNLFRHIGYGYPVAPCIYVGMVDYLKILHNTIKECAYSGMSVGWGWDRVYYELGEKVNVRDAEIAYNYIENYMDVLRDGGAIYVVGANCDIDISDRFNVMHDNFAILENSGEGEKFGYYCDGSATNWEVRHSVIINCPTPIFSQYTVDSAFAYHNHLFDIYSTKPVCMLSHAPVRDSLIYDFHLVEEGEEALYEKYPEAKEIRDAAGCNFTV